MTPELFTHLNGDYRERACTPPPEAHVASAARAFMELFVAENGDERALTVDDIDHAELTHRYAALEAALEIRSLVPARFRSPPSPQSNSRGPHPDQTSPMTVGPEAFFEDEDSRS